jgi:MOSC domain-containing protein YiiM
MTNMNGTIISIWRAENFGDPLEKVNQARVSEGKGIEGDRYFNKTNKSPGGELTFIDATEVERVNSIHGICTSPEMTRRNIITRGVDLNNLVGKPFSIGTAEFEGMELCQPCDYLGKLLKTETVTAKDIIIAYMGRGGLRTRIVKTGIIKEGDSIIHGLNTSL